MLPLLTDATCCCFGAVSPLRGAKLYLRIEQIRRAYEDAGEIEAAICEGVSRFEQGSWPRAQRHPTPI
jgi:hypothetical protein